MNCLAEVTSTGFKQDLTSIIFVGCFVVSLLVVAIWWLRR